METARLRALQERAWDHQAEKVIHLAAPAPRSLPASLAAGYPAEQEGIAPRHPVGIMGMLPPEPRWRQSRLNPGWSPRGEQGMGGVCDSLISW